MSVFGTAGLGQLRTTKYSSHVVLPLYAAKMLHAPFCEESLVPQAKLKVFTARCLTRACTNSDTRATARYRIETALSKKVTIVCREFLYKCNN